MSYIRRNTAVHCWNIIFLCYLSSRRNSGRRGHWRELDSRSRRRRRCHILIQTQSKFLFSLAHQPTQLLDLFHVFEDKFRWWKSRAYGEGHLSQCSQIEPGHGQPHHSTLDLGPWLRKKYSDFLRILWTKIYIDWI